MSQRLPPDIDRMLWEVAESQDTHAYDDFEKRFPHLVGELGKRIQLVRELRDARSTGSARAVPRFDRRVPTQIGPSPRLVFAGVAVLVASLGLAAYVVTTKLTHQPNLTQAPKVETAPPVLPDDVVNKPIPQPAPPNPNVTPTTSRGNGPDGTLPQQAPEQPSFMRPQSEVKFERVKLQLAILAVATSGKLDVEFAPNMPNPDIRMEYRNMSPWDILRDLGPKFGFSVIPDGRNRVIVVPAVDPHAGQLPPATGSGYASTLEAGSGAGGDAPTPSKPGPSMGPL